MVTNDEDSLAEYLDQQRGDDQKKIGEYKSFMAELRKTNKYIKQVFIRNCTFADHGLPG